MAKTAQGNQLTNNQKMRRKNKRTSIGKSKNSRPNSKNSDFNPLTKKCNR